MSNIFAIPDWEKFKERCYTCCFVAPELFLCGFLWSGFSIACNCSDESAAFYFSSGFGCGMGALFGHFVTHITFEEGYPMISRDEIFHGFAYFCAIFFGSGTTWQRIVNDTQYYNMTFTESFFYMWVLSFLLFFTVLAVLRFINTHFIKQLHILGDDFDSVKTRFYYDIQLSLSIGLADAFFVGTISDAYTDNWLGPAFGIHESTSPFVAMLKSGAATITGFLVSQIIQNAITKDNWIDPSEEVLEARSQSKASVAMKLDNMESVVTSPMGIEKN